MKENQNASRKQEIFRQLALDPEAPLTPKLVTQLLGKTRMDIAEEYGVQTRQQVYNILTGRSSHPKLLTALHAEVERILKIRYRMGATQN